MDYFGIVDESPHWPKSRESRVFSFPEDVAEEEKEKKEEFVTLTFPDGKIVKMPLLSGSQGPSAIDVRTLYSQSGCFTFDPGFTSTCSCVSDITYIDGPKGILQHRGYDIKDLCATTTFEEVIYLLLYGELPAKDELSEHKQHLKAHAMVHQRLIKFYDGFKADAHPMAIMVGVVGAMSAFFHDSLNIHDPKHRALSSYRLISKIPTIAAMAYKTSVGEPVVHPLDKYTYAENFLHMMFATPNKPYVVTPVAAKALETFLILHADHEQNASTSTVRIAGSSQANPFACIASGIAALWGPSHGGANEAVLKMLSEIGTVDNIKPFLEKVKAKTDGVRLMGFGHRVYKNFDPRAVHMKIVCEQLLKEMEKKDPLLQLAMELEEAALSDDYFVKRKLFPNVDFYSGIVLKALNIPVNMFTVLFAVARTTGWVSQWKEMIESPDQRIGRPRQLFTGKTARKVVPLHDRGEHMHTRLSLPTSGGHY